MRHILLIKWGSRRYLTRSSHFHSGISFSVLVSFWVLVVLVVMFSGNFLWLKAFRGCSEGKSNRICYRRNRITAIKFIIHSYIVTTESYSQIIDFKYCIVWGDVKWLGLGSSVVLIFCNLICNCNCWYLCRIWILPWVENNWNYILWLVLHKHNYTTIKLIDFYIWFGYHRWTGLWSIRMINHLNCRHML